jgi:hypothetical protein
LALFFPSVSSTPNFGIVHNAGYIVYLLTAEVERGGGFVFVPENFCRQLNYVE